MLLRSKTLPDWQGDPIKAADGSNPLQVAASHLGLASFNDFDIKSWKYGVQGIGNWLLWRSMVATCLAAFFLGTAGTVALHWALPQLALVFAGLAILLAVEIALFGTRWHTVTFGPDDPQAPRLTADLQSAVNGMTAEWQESGHKWPLSFSAEFLMQPLWRARRVCIFSICGADEDDPLIIALHPGD